MKRILLVLLVLVLVSSLVFVLVSCKSTLDRQFERMEETTLKFQEALAKIANSVPAEDGAVGKDEKVKLSLGTVSSVGLKEIVDKLQSVDMNEARYGQTVDIWKNTVPSTVLDIQIDPIVYARIASVTDVEFLNVPMNVRNDGCYHILEIDNGYSIERIGDMSDPNATFNQYEFSAYSGSTVDDISFVRLNVQLGDDGSIGMVECSAYAGGVYISLSVSGVNNIFGSTTDDMMASVEVSYLDKLETYTYYLTNADKYPEKGDEEIDTEQRNKNAAAILGCAQSMLNSIGISAQTISDNISYMRANSQDVYEIWNNQGEFAKLRQYVDEYRNLFNSKFDMLPVVEEFHVEDGVLVEYIGSADTVTIPDDVVTIGKDCAIYGKTLVIPEGLQTIEIDKSDSRYSLAKIQGFEEVIIAEGNENFVVDGAMVKDKDGNVLFLLINDKLEVLDYSQFTPYDIKEYISFYNKYKGDNHYEGFMYEVVPSVREVIVDVNIFNDSSLYQNCFPNLERLVLTGQHSENSITIDISPNTKISEIVIPEGIFDVSIYYSTPSVNLIAGSQLTALRLHNDKSTSMQLSVVTEFLEISSVSLESLVVPDGVESLEVRSASLKQLTVPASVLDFSMSCQQVEKLVFTGERQTIPCVLRGNGDVIQSLKEVVFPKGVTTIGGNAFSYTSIEKMVIPDTVTVIEDSAFSNCSKLTEIQLPESIETIGDRAFYGCSSLKSVNLPEGLTSLGDWAFEGAGLLSVSIPGSITQFGVSAFSNCQSLQQVEIGHGAVLAANAFYNCTALESVDLSGVEVVPSDAFYGCTSLVDLTFSSVAREIGDRAFYGCSSLEQLQLCEGLEIVGSDAFRDTAIKSLRFPSTLKSVASLICNSNMDEIVFSSSENPLSISIVAGDYPDNVYIKNIIISDNVTEISIHPGEFNFVYVDNLTIYGRPKVSLHNVTNVVFKDVYQSESEQYLDETRSFIDYSANVVWAQSEDYYTISYYNDDGSMIHSEQALEGTVYTPNLVPTSTKPTSVETNYKFVEWQDENNQPMSSFMVRGDVALHAVYQEVQTFIYEPYLDGVNVLGYSVEDYNPETIEVPKQLDGKNVLAIENGAFSQCTNVTTLIVPFIGSTEGGNILDIFAGSIPFELRNVVVTNSSITGVLERHSIESVVFEQPVTEILNYAFQNCSLLTNLQMDISQLQTIGAYAFYGCSVDLELPATLTSIGDNAFDNFSGSVNYLGSVDQWVSIEFGSQSSNPFYNSGEYVFNGTSLENVVISNAVTVNAHCFVNMKNVKCIVISDSVTNIDDGVFAGVQGVESMTFGLAMFGENSRELGWLFAPEDISIWETGLNSKYVPQTLTSVTITGTTSLQSGIISSISSLTSVIISPDCTVESWALYNLPNLQHVEFPYRTTENDVRFNDFFGGKPIYSLTSVTINSDADCIDFSDFANWMSENKQLYIEGSVNTIEYLDYAEWQLQDLYFEGDVSQWLSIEFVNQLGYMALAQNLYFGGELVEGELVIPEGTTVLPSYAFYYYDKIISIVIPSTVTDLGTKTFYSPVNYERVELNAVACSGEEVFGHTETSINEVYIGASVQSICDGLFQNTRINIVQSAPDSQCKYIGDNAFYVTNIAQLQLPEGLVSIGDNAFYGAKITELVLHEGVTDVGRSAFEGCSSLTSIDLPVSLVNIGEGAFSNISVIEHASIPANAVNYLYLHACTDLYIKSGDVGSLGATSVERLTFGEGVTSYNGDLTTSKLQELHLNVSSQFQASNLNFTSANGYVVYVGKEIPCIYDSWFLNANVTAVVFEEGSNCSYVGQSAFMNSGLVSIELPDSVTSVGDNAFANCLNLTTVKLPSGLEAVSVGMFSGCSSLLDIEIPSAVTVIHHDAFANCSSLTVVTLSSGLKNMDYSAFYSCTNLTNIELPEGLLSIGNSAFYGSGLLEVTIPETVNTLGSRVFANCYSLTSVVLPTNITTIGDSMFSGCTSLQDITIPNSVEEIGERAFINCNNIVELVIPISVSSIGMYAFEGLSANATIYCEASMKPTGWTNEWTDVSNVVWGYNNVTSNAKYDYVVRDQSAVLTKYKGDEVNVDIPAQVDGLPVKCLTEIFGDKQVISVILPDTLNEIHPYAFANCDLLVNLYIPESVSIVGEQITYRDFNVTVYCQAVSIPEGWNSEWVTDVDVYFDCESVLSNDYRYIIIDNQVMLVDYCGLAQSIGVPDRIGNLDVVSFGTAFSGNKELTYVNIPETITTVGKYAFYECSSLGYVRMSTGTTLIDDYAFYNCTQLQDVIIPSTVKSIGNYAFYDCTSISSIVIPISVEDMGFYAMYIGRDNVIYCEAGSSLPGWTSWENAGEVYWGYNNIRGVDFDYMVVDGNAVLTKYTGESTDVVIPSTIDGYNVVDFGHIFRYNDQITSVVIQHGATRISEDAFYGCDSLASVTIPSSVSYIGNSAFTLCRSLTSVTIPESVTSLGNSAFSGCASLTTAIILANVTSLGKDAFSYCSSLETVQLPQSLTGIGGSAFLGCENLTNIVLPDGLEYIEGNAFGQCTRLANIVLPTNLKSIGNQAFAGCEALVSIIVPASAVVECYSFDGCVNLSTFFYGGTYQQWIDSDMYTVNLCGATAYYYSETNPFDDPAIWEGNYWHFVDGQVTIWTKQ